MGRVSCDTHNPPPKKNKADNLALDPQPPTEIKQTQKTNTQYSESLWERHFAARWPPGAPLTAAARRLAGGSWRRLYASKAEADALAAVGPWRRPCGFELAAALNAMVCVLLR